MNIDDQRPTSWAYSDILKNFKWPLQPIHFLFGYS